MLTVVNDAISFRDWSRSLFKPVCIIFNAGSKYFLTVYCHKMQNIQQAFICSLKKVKLPQQYISLIEEFVFLFSTCWTPGACLIAVWHHTSKTLFLIGFMFRFKFIICFLSKVSSLMLCLLLCRSPLARLLEMPLSQRRWVFNCVLYNNFNIFENLGAKELSIAFIKRKICFYTWYRFETS